MTTTSEVTHAAQVSEHFYVYIAGPMTNGGIVTGFARAMNMIRGLEVASIIRSLGYVPFCPHLGNEWDLLDPRDFTDWLSYGKAWVERCDVVFRMLGKSRGADEETAHARALGIPVVDSYGELERVRRTVLSIKPAGPPPMPAEPKHSDRKV